MTDHVEIAEGNFCVKHGDVVSLVIEAGIVIVGALAGYLQ